MARTSETGGITGTRDKTYDLIWYVEACLDNALRLETYIHDAEREKDSEMVDLFRKAQADSRKGAEMGKQLLRSRLNGGCPPLAQGEPGTRYGPGRIPARARRSATRPWRTRRTPRRDRPGLRRPRCRRAGPAAALRAAAAPPR